MIPIVTPEPIRAIPSLAPHGITTSNEDEVSAFLKARPQLASLAENISKAVRAEFGPAAELALEVYRDPEIDDRHLVLYVRLDSYQMDIIDRIEAACAPFQDARELVPDYFLVTTDFRQPGGANGV